MLFIARYFRTQDLHFSLFLKVCNKMKIFLVTYVFSLILPCLTKYRKVKIIKDKLDYWTRGGWGEWSPYSVCSCSDLCCGGTMTRDRFCLDKTCSRFRQIQISVCNYGVCSRIVQQNNNRGQRMVNNNKSRGQRMVENHKYRGQRKVENHKYKGQRPM